MKKRPVEILVISDVHLGTYGCRAKELLKYLLGDRGGGEVGMTAHFEI